MLVKFANPGGQPAVRPGGHFASPVGNDRIVRREVALGLIREIVPPQTHIGLQIAPWLEVASDDVIFGYQTGMAEGLVPARAEDAESELARKDDIFLSEGRASVIDWAIKDHYDAGDVQRYREWLVVKEQMASSGSLPLTIDSSLNGFKDKMARDAARRRRKIDNRIEWLIMNQSLSLGTITYNDGKISFVVDFGRPAAQQGLVPGSAALGAAYTLGDIWSATSSDPIGDIQKIQEHAMATYGVRITRAIASRRILNSIFNSNKFIARTGLVVGGTPSSPIDPKYVVDGWGPNAAVAIVEQQTGLKFTEYDSVYRTRALAATTFVNNRFVPDNRIIFLPEEADINEYDDTDIGFGKTLTSPHPAGNWTPGFYEWEYEFGVDPWGLDAGCGIKAFPVFPHLDLTYTYDVLAA